jgi:hypothetical protein
MTNHSLSSVSSLATTCKVRSVATEDTESTESIANTMPNAVYNSPIPEVPVLLSRFPRVASSLFIILMVLDAAVARAENWNTVEEQLAAQIVAVTGPGAAAVEVSNRSSLSHTDADEIRRGLLTQLAALGMRFVNAEQAAASVQVSLSEDLQNYVWIAEIHQGANETSVVMVSRTRPETQLVGHEAAALALRKTLLWSQEDRILDVTVLDGNPSHMLVLASNAIGVYTLHDGRWQPDQSITITHSRPWPRDLRGKLVLRKDHLFDVFLPGVFCRSTTSAPLAINCYESDDPWPLGTDQLNLSAFFTAARNFFTGALTPGIGRQITAPAFYSAAALPREKYTLWIVAAVDGQVHLLDGITDQTAGKLGWGSDITSVHSGCGSGWQILATRSGVSPEDTVRAFEFPDREPIAASQPLEFSGGIKSLSTESGGSSAVAVSRNSETGRYEAFRLTINCGH